MRALAWLMLTAACAAACSDDAEEDARRALLKPADTREIRTKRAEAVRLADERGELLESDEVVAGIVLPRGFKLALVNGPAAYYESTVISFEQLERYFSARLRARAIDRSADAVRYVDARPKDGSDVQPAMVRIARTRGGKVELVVSRPPPTPAIRPSEAEVRAQMEARRKFAE
jgi:hypothetical protein